MAIWGSTVFDTADTAVAACEIKTYDLDRDKPSSLGKPSKSFRTDQLCLAVDWSPDDSSLAVTAVSLKDIGIKLLDLKTGKWTSLVTLPTNEEGVVDYYISSLRTMRWVH